MRSELKKAGVCLLVLAIWLPIHTYMTMALCRPICSSLTWRGVFAECLIIDLLFMPNFVWSAMRDFKPG